MPTGDLCLLDDVAIEMGLADQSAMSTNQQARATALISRVSHLFTRESDRMFLPGQDTVRLKVQYRTPFSYYTQAAYIWCSEIPDSVELIVDDWGNEITPDLYNIVDHEIRLLTLNYPRYLYMFAGGRYPYPEFVTVTYSHSAPVPAGVVQCVASVVARYINLESQFGTTTTPAAVELQAGGIAGYRARYAAWASQSVSLSPEDLATAHSYRYPGRLPMVVGT